MSAAEKQPQGNTRHLSRHPSITCIRANHQPVITPAFVLKSQQFRPAFGVREPQTAQYRGPVDLPARVDDLSQQDRQNKCDTDKPKTSSWRGSVFSFKGPEGLNFIRSSGFFGFHMAVFSWAIGRIIFLLHKRRVWQIICSL